MLAGLRGTAAGAVLGMSPTNGAAAGAGVWGKDGITRTKKERTRGSAAILRDDLTDEFPNRNVRTVVSRIDRHQDSNNVPIAAIHRPYRKN